MAESNTRQTLNELLVDLFNFILYIQEKYMKEKGVPLTMYEVHLLENVSKIKNNTIGNIADAMLVTKGTLSVNASRLIKKGYLTKYVDKDDRRVVRVEITDKASFESILNYFKTEYKKMTQKNDEPKVKETKFKKIKKLNRIKGKIKNNI